MTRRTYVVTVAMWLMSIAACMNTPANDSNVANGGGANTLPYTETDALFAALPKGDDARAVLCAPPLGQDDVVAHLCVPTPPVLTGVADVASLLGFSFANSTGSGSNGGSDGNPFFALTGHSSSLVVGEVSALNPRAILCKDFGAIPNAQKNGLANPNFFACMGFTRGENFVEVATTDAGTGELNFYVIKFETACSQAGTCTPGDVLTPADEKAWVAYNAYEDDPFFKNTIMDCRQCHQPDNAVDPMLRLQETTAPYTHFFSSQTQGGQALLADFTAGHGTNENYGPVPAALISKSDGGKLATFLQAEGFLNKQPNVFDSATIEAQVDSSASAQPASNRIAGTSAAWNQIFAAFQSGNAIPPPYHDVKVTDANKLANYTAAYVGVMNGSTSAAELPDIRQIFSDDPTILAQMGLAAVPNQTASQLFVSVCQQCHNGKLDPNISRAQFDVQKLLAGTLSASEKQVAISRLQREAVDVQLMPPKRFRTLSAAEISSMVAFLGAQ